MAHVLIQHEIGGWEEFENIFRGDADRRRALGCLGGKVFSNTSDPNNVFIALEWKDSKGAKDFADGLGTNEAMKWATSGMWSKVYVVEERFEVEA
jgi:hypothetical protein